ncbi:hypothetical protein IWQ60_004051 [Tieghemiomyces parasiticus]|uniref:Uncharacterized protein n=1 Tax=Tieghemiomyces parasiticus TaxID=78921 RepID=A0A9W8DVW1_9FUNG|nr:hypothetical protein IWQ60_004051 [Tieghemiomyces parasiticus]
MVTTRHRKTATTPDPKSPEAQANAAGRVGTPSPFKPLEPQRHSSRTRHQSRPDYTGKSQPRYTVAKIKSSAGPATNQTSPGGPSPRKRRSPAKDPANKSSRAKTRGVRTTRPFDDGQGSPSTSPRLTPEESSSLSPPPLPAADPLIHDDDSLLQLGRLDKLLQFDPDKVTSIPARRTSLDIVKTTDQGKSRAGRGRKPRAQSANAAASAATQSPSNARQAKPPAKGYTTRPARGRRTSGGGVGGAPSVIAGDEDAETKRLKEELKKKFDEIDAYELAEEVVI